MLNNTSRLLIGLGLTSILLTGCTKEIKDTPVSINAAQLKILRTLEPIYVSHTANRSFFHDTCNDRGGYGIEGYHLSSDNPVLGERKGKWVCALKMRQLNCPEMAIIVKNDNALAVKIDAKSGEYSKQDIKVCVIGAIDSAPTVLGATSDKN